MHGSYQQDWLASPRASSLRVVPEKGGRSRAFAGIGSQVSAGRKSRRRVEIDGSAGSAVFDQEHPDFEEDARSSS